MNIVDKIPDFADEALVTLLANAERLATAGSEREQQLAEVVIPAVLAEQEKRRINPRVVPAPAASPAPAPAPRKRRAAVKTDAAR